MQMDVKNRLTGILVAIHDHTIAAVGEAFLPGNRLRRYEQATDNSLIVSFNVVDSGNMLFRNDDYVCRRSWIDIAECQRRF